MSSITCSKPNPPARRAALLSDKERQVVDIGSMKVKEGIAVTAGSCATTLPIAQVTLRSPRHPTQTAAALKGSLRTNW
jgi:hypothetical protein